MKTEIEYKQWKGHLRCAPSSELLHWKVFVLYIYYFCAISLHAGRLLLDSPVSFESKDLNADHAKSRNEYSSTVVGPYVALERQVPDGSAALHLFLNTL